MDTSSIHRRYETALDALVEQIRADRSVLAAILCGSLSHDTVWDRSDIDLVLITIDDRKIDSAGMALDASGVNVHATLMPRAEFRRTVESAIHNSFFHSLLAKGRLLYTHDETIADLCAGLHRMGERDAKLQLLQAATSALPPVYKAHKWFLTRRDLDYTALWILYAATPLAKVEVLEAGRLVDREVLPQAMELNPAFFRLIYRDLLNAPKTADQVRAALDAVDEYLARRAPKVFSLVLEHLAEVGEARSSTEIESHFRRQFNVHDVVTACEYLADQRLLGRAATAVQLTRRSNVRVQELAFFTLEAPARDS
jgi:predicted nucleotidyltransferase